MATDDRLPTDAQRLELLELVRDMRAIAGPADPMHGSYELIADVEALCAGRVTLLTMSPDDYIAMCRKTLAQHRAGGV